MKRMILIVLDSVGMGELPDALEYGDVGSNTLGNIARAVDDFSLPNLQKLGLGNIDGMIGFPQCENPAASYGRMAEQSKGKDTTTGHWEMMGIILNKPFPVYPMGFPKDVIQRFENRIGTKILGNFAASGTEILIMLGEEHMKTGYPIVYTSADSVFQIAAHEAVISIDRLYEQCAIAREQLVGEHAVGRVIARPFEGQVGNFKRTTRRKDYSLKPHSKIVLEGLTEKGYKVCAVGKIEDIFSGVGITHAVHTKNNMQGIDQTLRYMQEDFEGLIFTNLVDFDMLYGHRNDVRGYANALKEFDNRLPEIIDALKEEDILVITADHGCDPTTKSTDHSREYVPLLVYGKTIKKGHNLGSRKTFSDIAVSLSKMFTLDTEFPGISFLEEVVY